jgi:2-oxoglutarate dehydrogenase E1 component
MVQRSQVVDWTTAEVLAMATLAGAGIRLRLTGLKSETGPFGDRHLVLHDVVSETRHVPLQNLSPNQAPVEILSTREDEIAAFSLEYAYSLGLSSGLSIWQAHTDDFIDRWEDLLHRLIRRGQSEWGQRSSMVLLLPQDLGNGRYGGSTPWPKHWIQLIAQNHVQVCIPATPDQYFHLLRRQAWTRPSTPLVVIIPGRALSLHPYNVSHLGALASGEFRPILPDQCGESERVRRIVICSGKTYYDLDRKRVEERRRDVAILRLQQIYPLSGRMILDALAPYPDDAEVVWVQDEPEETGVWPYLSLQFGADLESTRRFFGVFRLHPTGPGVAGRMERTDQGEFLKMALTGYRNPPKSSASAWGTIPRRDHGSLISVDSMRVANINPVRRGTSRTTGQPGRYEAGEQA